MPSPADEAARRRTFAIISHPDAGKTTLTEKFLLYGGALSSEAGSVKARTGRRSATSDWMALEQQRGISITSTVLQFPYRDCVVNLLDTPGHRDFSEDTYRVLAAADAALAAHVEQLERLGLDALGGVEHHHRGVGGGEHAVGVLGEVPVTRGVEQVDHVIAVRELQHGRRDRDAALLFEGHPVRGRRAATAAGLDRAGLGTEGAAVEQELLGEGGLARVRMADDGEGAPSTGLRDGGAHPTIVLATYRLS